MRGVSYVAQEDRNGCLLACIAMILGVPYAEVRADFTARDVTRESFCITDADHYLVDRGFAVARKYRPCNWNNTQRYWPPAPFAEVHLCAVQATPQSPFHAVIMLSHGTVYDPAIPFDIERLRGLSAYGVVNNVAAVVPIRG